MKKIFLAFITIFSVWCAAAQTYPAVFSYTDKYGAVWKYSFEDEENVKKILIRKSGDTEITAGKYKGNIFADGDIELNIDFSEHTIHLQSGFFQGPGYYYDHYYLIEGKSLNTPLTEYSCTSNETVYNYSFYDGGLIRKQEIYKNRPVTTMGFYEGNPLEDGMLHIKILGEPVDTEIKNCTFITEDYKLFKSSGTKVLAVFKRSNKKGNKIWTYIFYEGGFFDYSIENKKKKTIKITSGIYEGEPAKRGSLKVDHYLAPDFSTIISEGQFTDRFGKKFNRDF